MAHLKYKLQLHKFIQLRQRYIFSKSGKVRLRYALGFAVVTFLMTGITARSAYMILGPYMPETPAVQNYEQADAGEGITYLTGNQLFGDGMKSRISESMRMATTVIQKPKKPLNQTLKIGSGDTLAGVLQEAGVEGQDAFQIVKTLSKHYDPRNLRAGQVIDITFKPVEGAKPVAEGEDEVLEFAQLSMKLSPIKEVLIDKEGANFNVELKERELQERDNARNAEVNTSLYGSAARAGIPSPVIAEVIRVYSQNVDFQRDIRRGDKIQVLYKTFETEDGDFAKYGDLLYANLVIGGKNMPVYRFKTENGVVDYYNDKGQSNKKTLMKTPIDGARISSGFGLRKHPILGYNKMHKGMDFAAATGTPIYASGNGTIAFAGRKGAYGNYIQIKHNATLSTAYAHMLRFASNISTGARVKQGQIIGYVGTTGRSTGPHLHYEVLLSGVQVNPNRVDLPTGETLKGKDIKKFQAVMASLSAQYTKLAGSMKMASLDLTKKETIR